MTDKEFLRLYLFELQEGLTCRLNELQVFVASYGIEENTIYSLKAEIDAIYGTIEVLLCCLDNNKEMDYYNLILKLNHDINIVMHHLTNCIYEIFPINQKNMISISALKNDDEIWQINSCYSGEREDFVADLKALTSILIEACSTPEEQKLYEAPVLSRNKMS